MYRPLLFSLGVNQRSELGKTLFKFSNLVIRILTKGLSPILPEKPSVLIGFELFAFRILSIHIYTMHTLDFQDF